MQLSMKCSIAVHCLIFIHEAKGIARVTSPLLAESTGCNPVIIRNVISSLKKAGIITVARGTGGAELCMDPSEITLFMIYNALEPKGLSSLIGIHPCVPALWRRISRASLLCRIKKSNIPSETRWKALR